MKLKSALISIAKKRVSLQAKAAYAFRMTSMVSMPFAQDVRKRFAWSIRLLVFGYLLDNRTASDETRTAKQPADRNPKHYE